MTDDEVNLLKKHKTPVKRGAVMIPTKLKHHFTLQIHPLPIFLQ